MDYYKRPIRLFGSVTIPVSSNGWKVEDTTHDPKSHESYWKSYFAKRYAHVFNRLGRSKKSQILYSFQSSSFPRQVKGRKNPIHIQDRVAGDLGQGWTYRKGG